MKKLLSFAVAICVLTACKTNKGNPSPDYTHGIIAAKQWAGTESYTYSISFSKPARTIADTTLSFIKMDNATIAINGAVLKYRSTDSATQTAKFDTVNHTPQMGNYGTWTTLTHYYLSDSIVFSNYVSSPIPNLGTDDYQGVNLLLHTPK